MEYLKKLEEFDLYKIIKTQGIVKVVVRIPFQYDSKEFIGKGKDLNSALSNLFDNIEKDFYEYALEPSSFPN